MARFVIVNNNVIENFILADSKEIAEAITGLTAYEGDDPRVWKANVGFVWSEEAGVFVNPNSSEQKAKEETA